tara:strand:- start:839 stop:1189 length:351 start_codon:yes stop_codon:yes gene_type:complete
MKIEVAKILVNKRDSLSMKEHVMTTSEMEKTVRRLENSEFFVVEVIVSLSMLRTLHQEYIKSTPSESMTNLGICFFSGESGEIVMKFKKESFRVSASEKTKFNIRNPKVKDAKMSS